MKQYKDKNWLHKMYWDKKLSIRKIAKICNIGRTTVFYWMNKLGIPRQDKADASKKYLINDAIFENCDTPEKAYWLGFIMADGCVHKTSDKSYTLEIKLNHKDKEHLYKFREFLNSDVPIKERWETSPLVGMRKSALIVIHRKKIVESVEKYGIIQRKTGKEQIKNIPEKYYPDFIRGYFDGDGCLCGTRKKERAGIDLYFTITCASKLLLTQIQNILIKNRGLSKTKIYSSKKYCYNLIYGGNLQVPRIFNYLLQNSNVKLERKYKALTEI